MIEQSSLMSVTEARELAVRAHGDQRDRDGSFHIAHVARVAEQVPREASYQRVAWLHDVVEDSQLTVGQLHLPDVERAAIASLTRDEREPYQDRGEWELPGGRPNPGASYPDCLTREILEETALRATVGSLIIAYPYERCCRTGGCMSWSTDASCTARSPHNPAASIGPSGFSLPTSSSSSRSATGYRHAISSAEA